MLLPDSNVPAQPLAVVGAAVLAGGRLLVQQRAYPPDVSGRWELPGGRVEPGETERQAVTRECREELGVEVHPDERIGGDVTLAAGVVLRIYRARLVDPAAQPRALHHRALRWVDSAHVPDLDWLEADRALVAELVAAMTS